MIRTHLITDCSPEGIVDPLVVSTLVIFRGRRVCLQNVQPQAILMKILGDLRSARFVSAVLLENPR